MTPVYIVDIIGECVAAAMNSQLQYIQTQEMQLFGQSSITTIDYQYGHIQELLETLFQMTKSPEEYLKKYPLVYLVQDFEEERGTTGYYADVRLNIIIAHSTVNTYKITDRMRLVFKPVLYPIYYALLDAMANHPSILQGAEESIPHRKTDRSYWGSNKIDGNQNVLNDYVDAIELENLNLKINYSYCVS